MDSFRQKHGKKNSQNLSQGLTLRKGGFTVAEIMMVVFFTIILTSITLFNYKNFDDTVELRNQTLEVALTLREAQIFALSSKQSGSTGYEFRDAYGVFFDTTISSSSLMFFVDNDSVGADYWFDATDFGCTDSECERVDTLRSGYKITDICVPEDTCGLDRVSIAYDRPNPNSLIRRNNDPDLDQASAKIEITSPKGATSSVHITKSGQIYVK